ncbi:hypothetical protein LX36DRAFT_269611 [Colletotrichum falcatum]|nr:hypothetical protein LX36DRAFT_269611 [Colletotrichum falcatum]
MSLAHLFRSLPGFQVLICPFAMFGSIPPKTRGHHPTQNTSRQRHTSRPFSHQAVEPLRTLREPRTYPSATPPITHCSLPDIHGSQVRPHSTQ